MATFPTPGTPVRGSRSGKPIMALFDLLGRSWCLGVLWTLCKAGPCTFRDLQTRCESISPTVLNARLKELREAVLVEHAEGGYQATATGHQLFVLLEPLGKWSNSWSKQITGRDWRG
nr:helix-turn-helix domain-containing protein [uncultured Dongia sp.]